MTAREYLKKPKELENEIRRKRQRLENLRGVVLNITPRYDVEAVQHSRDNNPLGSIAAEIVDIERELKFDADKLSELKAKVWKLLDLLDDERLKRVLWLKYCERKQWFSIAEELNLTRRHVLRLHRMAIDRLEKNFEKNKNVTPCHLDVTP